MESEHDKALTRFVDEKFAAAMVELDRVIADDYAKVTGIHSDYWRTYPNGCPILDEK